MSSVESAGTPPRCSVMLADEAASVAFAGRLAARVSAPLTVFLKGDLGAGKTTLVRAFLRALGVCGPVPSPTYTLVEIYDTARLRVQHLDLYRLADAEELEFIGARDYFAEHAVRFIEWPQRGEGMLPAPDLELELAEAGGGRQLEVRGHGPEGCRLVAEIEQWKDL